MNKVELVYITPNAAQKIEKIACVCYDSKPTDDCAIFKNCMKSGHMSVAEHSDVTFKITCSRACSHQLVRHRTGKFSQRSQRYCKEDGFKYYIPKSIKDNKYICSMYENIIGQIQTLYNILVEEYNVPAEDARYILPNACETTIYITIDFRNLFHFFNERLCTRAQTEIRDIAIEMAKQLVNVCPTVKPFCVPKCETHPIAYCTENKCCGRHKPLKEIVKEEYL